MSRRAATTTTSICGVRALLGRDAADDLVLEHRLVERHRHLLLGLEADGRVHLLRVLDRRQPQRADDDPLVADPEPHLLGELVLGEERLQRLGEACPRRRPRPRGRRRARAARSPPRRSARMPLTVDLGRGDAAGLDVEAATAVFSPCQFHAGVAEC